MTQCSTDTPHLTVSQISEALATLPGWTLGRRGLQRRYAVKGFAKATYLANLAIFLADDSGHHPDMSLGWGYFELAFTTHEAGGVTAIDLACARRFDALAGHDGA